MKIQSFKLKNNKAFVVQLVILLLVLVVIGESVYLYTDYRSDELREQNNSSSYNYDGELIPSESIASPFPTPKTSVKVPSITVLSPNGGEKLISGNKYEIKWVTSNGSDFVRLFLMPGDIPITSMANAAAQFSSPFSWTVPLTLLPGQYKIEARLYTDAGDVPTQVATDSSDDYISIVADNKVIKVISPNGGEQLASGFIHQIKWNYPNATSTSKVDLYLFDPGSSYYPCVRTAYSCTPSFRADLDKNIFANTTYSWIVGTDIVNNIIRPGYYLMQICIAGTNDCDVSDKPFEIISSAKIEPLALPNSPVTSYYSQELEVIGFSTSTVQWQIVGGSLPPGLYLEKQGLTCTSSYPSICPRPETIMFKALIVGGGSIPKPGNYNFTVKASNDTQSVTKNYSLKLY